MAKRYYFEGEERTVYQIAKMKGIDRAELRDRLNHGLAPYIAVMLCKKIIKPENES